MKFLLLSLFALAATLCTPTVRAQTLESYANRTAIRLVSTNSVQVTPRYVRTARIAAVTVTYATPYVGTFTLSTLTGLSAVEVERCTTAISNTAAPGYASISLAPSVPAYIVPGEPIYISASSNLTATVYLDLVYQ